MEQHSTKLPIVLAIVTLLVVAGGIIYYVIGSQAKPKGTATLSQPAASAPAETTQEEIAASEQDPNQKWSTSPQGPYHDKISYATSTDLLKWTDSGKVIMEHASVPDIMLKDGMLYMYFVDVTTDGKPEQIGLMKSSDNGKTWTEREFVSIKGKNVAKIIPVDPDPVLLADGRIRLYYYDISGRPTVESKTKNKIYSAVSSDGVNFTQEEGVRFEDVSIFDPDVIKVGDTWRLYVGSPAGQTVISAISSDGLNFIKEGVAYEGSAVPNAIFENNTYYLYTAGIQIATSTDGKTYAKSSSNFKSTTGTTADPGVVKLGDKSYLMVYKTSSQKALGAPPLGNQPPQ
jgi:hypothetical protein